jgi:hypothetical protein
MSSSDHTSIGLRPIRSPKWANTAPPIGRAMKPTANEPNAASVPVTGSNAGKNTSLNTSAAAVPKMKKSYHSIVVPTRLANATLREALKDTPVLAMVVPPVAAE